MKQPALDKTILSPRIHFEKNLAESIAKGYICRVPIISIQRYPMKLITRSFPIILVFAIAVPFALGQETAGEYLEKGKEVAKRGKYEEAIKYFDQAIRLDSQFVEALMERSRAKQNNQRDLDGAMEDLETLLKLDPANGKAFYVRSKLRRALMYRVLKQKGLMLEPELLPFYQEILDDINAAISNGYRNKTTLQARAGLYSRTFKKHTEAIEDYTEALLLDPRDPGLFISRAVAKSRMGDEEGSAEDNREIIRIYEEAKTSETDTDSLKLGDLKRYAIVALNNISREYLNKEQFVLYLWAIEKSIEFQPNPNAFTARGRYQMIFGDLDKAIADYTKAIELFRGNSAAARVFMNRGIAYTLNGDLEKAESDFAEVRKDPQENRLNLKYMLELSRRQREERKIKVKLPNEPMFNLN